MFFPICVEDSAIFDGNLGFSTTNCIYYQLERSEGQSYGEHMGVPVNRKT